MPKAYKSNKRGNGKHVAIFEDMQRTDAWRTLKPSPRALYVEIKRRFYGSNNGQILLSYRDAAIKYLKEVEPSVPLIMPFGEAPLEIPEGEDRWDYWLWWLKTRGLFSAITELQHMPFWAEPRGFNNRKGYMNLTEIAPKKEYIN